jgi:hypothetical protein
VAFRICGGDESPIPQFDLVAAFDSLWVACRGKGQVLRLDPETGEVHARIPTRGVVSLAADDQSVWAVYRELGTVYRIYPSTDRVTSTVKLLRDTPYIWSQAGSVWVGVPGNVVGRIAPARNELIETIDIGDGVSDMVATEDGLLAICHRDSTLWRIDPERGEATLLGEVPGDTPERLALWGDTLWAAGRGVDLMQLDPATAKAKRTIEVGTGTIDVASRTTPSGWPSPCPRQTNKAFHSSSGSFAWILRVARSRTPSRRTARSSSPASRRKEAGSGWPTRSTESCSGLASGGSTPGTLRSQRGYSSVGRAPGSHPGGRRFESG